MCFRRCIRHGRKTCTYVSSFTVSVETYLQRACEPTRSLHLRSSYFAMGWDAFNVGGVVGPSGGDRLGGDFLVIVYVLSFFFAGGIIFVLLYSSCINTEAVTVLKAATAVPSHTKACGS